MPEPTVLPAPDAPADGLRAVAVRDLVALDTLPPDALDRITRLAQRLFGVPMALVALVEDDFVRVQSAVGLDVCQAPRGVSFTTHAVASDAVFVVEDAWLDRRFSASPLVTGPPFVRFYAGAPLHFPSGKRVGALCVLSDAPRVFTDEEAQTLRDLAALVASELQLYREVQEHDRTALRLRSSEERARLLVQHLSDVICVMEPDGVLTYVSPSCERVLGSTADALVGQNAFAFVHPDDQLHAVHALRRCAEVAGVSPPIDFRWSRPDGSYVALEALGHNLLHEPALRGIVVTARDATEQRRAIAALEQSLEKERQVNELRASFVAMASHEFRTPLATILSSASLATRFFDKSREKAEKHLQRISTTVQDMMNLLDDILDLERLGTEVATAGPQHLDLPALLAELFEELRFGLGARHTLKLSGEVPGLMEADRITLRLVLSNLLSNAVKYSPPGSTVWLDVSRPEPGAPVVHFRVTDQGIGIPPAEMALLFEPFHRAANVGTIKGTGLGLAMVKRAVERCGGTIGVESRLGAGTTFEVMLPLRLRRA